MSTKTRLTDVQHGRDSERKRNPTDATLRNVRASRKDAARLEQRLKSLERRVKVLESLTKLK